MVPGISSALPIAESLNGIALAFPQQNIGYQPVVPGASNNPPAFLFHYEGENTFDLTSDITDHYIEDNTAIQDQVALRPEKVTVHGFIGELNDVAPPFILSTLKALASLPLISAFSPSLSISAQQTLNTAQQGYQAAQGAVNSAVSAWSSIVNGSPGQTKQSVAFQQFYGYWKNHTLWTVQTPWAVIKDMVIDTLKARQDEQTRMITDFQVTFKKLRFATTQDSQTTAAGRAVAQGAPPVDHGTTSPPQGASVSDAFATVPR